MHQTRRVSRGGISVLCAVVVHLGGASVQLLNVDLTNFPHAPAVLHFTGKTQGKEGFLRM
jgi:hypothetical protein